VLSNEKQRQVYDQQGEEGDTSTAARLTEPTAHCEPGPPVCRRACRATVIHRIAAGPGLKRMQQGGGGGGGFNPFDMFRNFGFGQQQKEQVNAPMLLTLSLRGRVPLLRQHPNLQENLGPAIEMELKALIRS
jgi:hypothetical protein